MNDSGVGAARDDAPRLGLRERKAIETRRRLLTTALDLMSREGPGGVTIGGVADRSDIAVGTFYNYFASREALIETVVDIEIGTVGRRLDALLNTIDDPAGAFSAVSRHIIRIAILDPVWGGLLVRLGPESEGAGILTECLARIIQNGASNGRFMLVDVQTTAAMTVGALLAAIRVFLDSGREYGEAASSFVENQLRALGIASSEAAKLATRWLPELPVVADQGASSIVRVAL